MKWPSVTIIWDQIRQKRYPLAWSATKAMYQMTDSILDRGFAKNPSGGTP